MPTQCNGFRGRPNHPGARLAGRSACRSAGTARTCARRTSCARLAAPFCQSVRIYPSFEHGTWACSAWHSYLSEKPVVPCQHTCASWFWSAPWRFQCAAGAGRLKLICAWGVRQHGARSRCADPGRTRQQQRSPRLALGVNNRSGWPRSCEGVAGGAYGQRFFFLRRQQTGLQIGRQATALDQERSWQSEANRLRCLRSLRQTTTCVTWLL